MMKIYLAGPDVFLENAAEVLAQKSKVLIDIGIMPLVPQFNESHVEIYKANIEMIKDADIVIANLQPFRGTEPDSGTVFEVGYANAMGITVFAYGVPNDTYQHQVNIHEYYQSEIGERGYLKIDNEKCSGGWNIENFGMRLNLMLTNSVVLCDTFEAAVKEALIYKTVLSL